MNGEKLLEAIVRVLATKNLISDSLIVQETQPGKPADNIERGHWERSFSLTFTEILREEDIKEANDRGGIFKSVYEQIRDKYNEITRYDFDVKKTESGIEVSAEFLG